MTKDHVVDVGYDLKPYDMMRWCEENLSGPIVHPPEGGWHGPDWLICHTTSDTEPYYWLTRGRFHKAEDAMMFRLRWS